jgi:hypothetical protein
MSENYINKAVRAAAILTNAYVAGTVITDAQSYNQLIVECDFTIGSLTDTQIKVEFSWDSTNYFQETFSAVTAGVSTESLGVHKLAATGKYTIAVPIVARNIKISAIGTGTVTSSSLAITAVLAKV